jgi:hypothetical protein
VVPFLTNLARTTFNQVLVSLSPILGFNAPDTYQFVAGESNGRCLKPETTQKIFVEAPAIEISMQILSRKVL